jgi:hypothetical protein
LRRSTSHAVVEIKAGDEVGAGRASGSGSFQSSSSSGRGGDWDCDIMTYTFIDVRRWQARAEQMRIMAEQMDNAEAREIMLRLAADYERLAEWALHQLA